MWIKVKVDNFSYYIDQWVDSLRPDVVCDKQEFKEVDETDTIAEITG